METSVEGIKDLIELIGLRQRVLVPQTDPDRTSGDLFRNLHCGQSPRLGVLLGRAGTSGRDVDALIFEGVNNGFSTNTWNGEAEDVAGKALVTARDQLNMVELTEVVVDPFLDGLLTLDGLILAFLDQPDSPRHGDVTRCVLGSAPQQTQARDDSAREYAEAVVDMTETGGMVSAETLAARWEEQGPAMTLAERALEDREWTYGHLVVDEAQELSPMQWRVLFRRVPSKSATVVGDLAQSSQVDNARTWSSILSEFVGDRFALQVLTVSYRTPQSVMDLANRYLHRHFPQLELVESVRQGGSDPQLDSFADESEMLAALPETVAAEVSAAAGGKIAVIADEELIEPIAKAVADFDFGRSVTGLDHQIALITPQQAKGLEFDAVIIVEPGRIAPLGSEEGVGGLYVALTRTTERLRVLASVSTELTELFSAEAVRQAG